MLVLSGALHLNWYPFKLPNMIETNILYVGVLFRYGISRLTVNTTNEEGNYQIYRKKLTKEYLLSQKIQTRKKKNNASTRLEMKSYLNG